MKRGKHHTINDIGNWPLLRLAAELTKVSNRILKAVNGSAVLEGYFDPHVPSVVAPDHLLTRIGQMLDRSLLFATA